MNTSIVRRFTPVLAVLLGMVALQCIEQPDDFIAPTSDIQLSIPLADITRTMDELFSKDTTTVKPDGFGGFYFEDTQEADPTRIDSIKVRPQPSGSSVGVGIFEVAGIPSAPVSFSSSSMGIVDNTYPFFPGASGPMPSLPVDFSALFDFMAVSQGSLSMTVTNNFPVPISFSGPLVLQNGSDNSVVTSFSFPTLQPGTSDTQIGDLAGKYLEGSLSFAPVNINAGSTADSVTFDSNSKLTFDFSSSAILVDSAAAVIPAQTVATITDSIIVIDDSVSVTRASFGSGSFIARITNNLGMNVGVFMQFDNFRNPTTGSVLRIDQSIPPYSVVDFPVELDTVDMVDPVPAALGSRMKFSVGIETINSGGAKSTITKNDFILAEFLPQDDFVLTSVEGRILPTVVDINSGSSGADLGEAADKFAGTFTFDSVRIAVDLGLSGGFPIGYDLILWARNSKTGVEDSLVVPPPEGQVTNLVTPGQGQFARIVLGNSAGLNTFLSRFVPNLPDTFVVRGQLVVNPNFDNGLIQEPTEVFQRINTYFPLKFGLANGELKEAVDLAGSNFPTDFIGDVRESSIRIAATNHLPVELDFRAALLGPTSDLPGAPRDTLLKLPIYGESRTIQAPAVDLNGNVVGPVESAFRFTLTPPDVDQFNKADTMIITFAVQTSNNGSVPVRYQASDFIRLRMSGNLVYILREKKEGE